MPVRMFMPEKRQAMLWLYGEALHKRRKERIDDRLLPVG